jgi:thiosulfate/3-mercaptopyruvate sulfurtransferase
MLETPYPSADERAAQWASALNGHGGDPDLLRATLAFRLTPAQVARAAVATRLAAQVNGREAAAADLQAVWRAAGIEDDSTVVVYDGGSGLASARAWWLLRWSGLRDVRVLDGGLAAWSTVAERPTAAGAERADHPGTVTVRPGAMPVVEVDRATELAESGGLIDARAAARYRGEIEPLDPVAGHIPGSLNLPITDLLSADGTFRSATELRAAFAALGVLADQSAADQPQTVAASCGSGITACQLILAAQVAGLQLALYPGSYSQWCALGRPVAVGG